MIKYKGTKKAISLHDNRRHLILILSALLLLIGLILVIYGALEYRTTTKQPMEMDRVGVVIDAGGSGTRMLIYKYANDTMTQLDYIECEDRGLTKYLEEELPSLRYSLTECFEKGGATLPKENVPIYFAATAGMRILRLRDRKVYDDIWTLVRECIELSQFKMEIAETIAGSDEAKWAWVAANYLKGSLSKDANDTFGTIELGSSSAQIAFQHGTSTLTGHEKVHDSQGGYISIYAHSYICYGAAEMSRRFLAKLVKNANYRRLVKNPCYFKDYSKELTSTYIFDEPCSKGKYAQEVLGESIDGPANKTFTIVGTGNFTQCYELIKKLNKKMNCTQKDERCGLNNLYQPKVHGKFLAMSTFWYTSDSLELSDGSSQSKYLTASQKYCGRPWGDIARGVNPSALKYTYNKCFQASYGYFLLANGFKFDKESWNIDYVNKINGSNVGWALGLIYSFKDTMYPRLKEMVIVVRKPGFISMLVLGPLCIIFAIGVLFCIRREKWTKVPV